MEIKRLASFLDKTSQVSESQRLVPSNFVYGLEQAADEVARLQVNDKRLFGQTYPGYPRRQDRAKLIAGDYKTKKALGALGRFLVGTPNDRPIWFVDDVGRYENGDYAKPRSNTDDIRELYPSDYPVHPFIKEMLDPKGPGAAAGPGYYWRLGANLTADPVIFREQDGWLGHNKLQVLLVKGKDGRGWVLPGGDRGGEDGLTAAAREAAEETGIDLGKTQARLVLKDSPVGDWRTTANAWPQTDVWMYSLPSELSNQKVKGKDDAKKAKFMTVSRRTLNRMSFSHPSYVKLSVQEWQNQTGQVVKRNGRIGVAA